MGFSLSYASFPKQNCQPSPVSRASVMYNAAVIQGKEPALFGASANATALAERSPPCTWSGKSVWFETTEVKCHQRDLHKGFVIIRNQRLLAEEEFLKAPDSIFWAGNKIAHDSRCCVRKVAQENGPFSDLGTSIVFLHLGPVTKKPCK